MHWNAPDDGGRPKRVGVGVRWFIFLVVKFMNSPVTQTLVLCFIKSNSEI
jgi:hypothetical protein